MADVYRAVITKDILKKRKKWVDGIVTIDSCTRAVKVSESGGDSSNEGRQLYSGIVDAKTLIKIIDYEEVKLGSCLVTITESTSTLAPVHSGVETAHPKVSVVPSNISCRPKFSALRSPVAFQTYNPANSTANESLMIKTTCDTIVQHDVLSEAPTSCAPIAATGGLMNLRVFTCPSSKYSRSSSSSSISSSSSSSSSIRLKGVDLGNAGSSCNSSKIMSAFTINNYYNLPYRICHIDQSYQSCMSYAVQFSSAVREELRLSLASTMSSIEERVLRALGISKVKPPFTSSSYTAAECGRQPQPIFSSENKGTPPGGTNNLFLMKKLSQRPSFDSITETMRGASLSFINRVEVIVSPPKDEEYSSKDHSSSKWSKGKNKYSSDPDEDLNLASKKSRNGDESAGSPSADKGPVEGDTKLYFKVSESKHRSNARGILF